MSIEKKLAITFGVGLGSGVAIFALGAVLGTIGTVLGALCTTIIGSYINEGVGNFFIAPIIGKVKRVLSFTKKIEGHECSPHKHGQTHQPHAEIAKPTLLRRALRQVVHAANFAKRAQQLDPGLHARRLEEERLRDSKEPRSPS